LERPTGYEDVHGELVVEDAMHPDWAWELLYDDGSAVVIAITRPEGYELAHANELAREAVRSTWPTWSLARQLNKADVVGTGA
jgi:hypothetical protein